VLSEAYAYIDMAVGLMVAPNEEQSAKEAVAYTEANVGNFSANSYIGRVVGYMPAWPADVVMNVGVKRQHSFSYIMYTEANILSTSGALPGDRATIVDSARGVDAGSTVSLASTPVVLTFSNPATSVTVQAPRRIRFRARSTVFESELHFDLLEGAALVTEFSQVLTTTWETYTYDLPSYLVAGITDYNNVSVRITAEGDPGHKVQLSWLEMEVPGAVSGTERTSEDGSTREVESGFARTLET
jgi:hypothetical protein